MRNVNELPKQTKADIGEVVDAFYHGGKRLGALTFRAISEARHLTTSETVMLGDYVRGQLTTLGYLPIGGK